MQTPIKMNQQFLCSIHPQQKIMFVCAVNDWHFQPLCQLCIPNHTKNHAKRLTINLQTVEDINNKVNGRKGKVIQGYENQMNRIKQIIGSKQQSKEQNSSEFMQNLIKVEERFINQVKNIFNNIKCQYYTSQNSQIGENKQRLQTLSQNIQKQIDFICNPSLSSQINRFEGWKNSVKKIYFVQKSETYIEQAKEIYEEYSQRVKQFEKSFNKGLKQLVDNQGKTIKEIEKLLQGTGLKYELECVVKAEQVVKNAVLKPQKSIKKPIPKPKRKLCKNCNQEMQYLTQNHKHLICKSCNYKERNYVKK